MFETVINNVKIILYPQKFIFLPEYGILAFSDVHLGKASHFRSKGIPFPDMPSAAFSPVIRALENLPVKSIFILGDFFHSTINNEWYLAEEFFSAILPFETFLIQGNHDIINSNLYKKWNIKIEDSKVVENILFSHYPTNEADKNNFSLNIHGHIHPGYLLRGKAKQVISIPCFYFSGIHFCLPAFGLLTGLHKVKPKSKKDRVYIISTNKVSEIPL